MRLPVPVRPVAYHPPADLSNGSRIAKNINLYFEGNDEVKNLKNRGPFHNNKIAN
jgi:hypothetical protein